MLVNIGIIIIVFLLLMQEYTVYCSPQDSFILIDTMKHVNAG